jgi:hypothetical protein
MTTTLERTERQLIEAASRCAEELLELIGDVQFQVRTMRGTYGTFHDGDFFWFGVLVVDEQCGHCTWYALEKDKATLSQADTLVHHYGEIRQCIIRKIAAVAARRQTALVELARVAACEYAYADNGGGQ